MRRVRAEVLDQIAHALIQPGASGIPSLS
jgi:hypothetical protein